MKFSWADTLDNYLKSSNEDEMTATAFCSHILPMIGNSRVLWFEIGPGPGTKTLLIYRDLMRCDTTLLKITLLEPDSRFYTRLRRTLATIAIERQVKSRIELLNVGLESLVQTDDIVIPGVLYLFTCIHVLYSRALVELMSLYLSRLRASGVTFVSFITVEAGDSDLAMLRMQLHEAGLYVPHEASAAIEESLLKTALPFERQRVDNQICLLDGPIPEWFCPFILGMSKKEFAGHDRVFQYDVLKKVTSFVLKRGELLRTPDIAYIVRTE